MSTDEARDATRGSAVKLIAEVLGRSLQLLTTLLLGRSLGAADFGLFGTLSSIAVVAAEGADLGLQGTATPALVSRTLSLRGILRAKAWLSGVFVLVAALVWPVFPLLVPLLLYFAGAGWAEILGVALRARGQRRGEAAVILALRLAGLVLVAAVLFRGGTLMACAWALALSTLPPCLLAGVLLGRAPAPATAHPVPGDPAPLAVLRASFPLAVNGGLALLSLRVELLVMSVLRAPDEVGYFNAALLVVQALNFVPNALCAGAMPALTREALRVQKGGEPEEGQGDAVRRRTAAMVAFAAVPAAIGLALVAPTLPRVLFKEAFADAALPLAVFALSVVPLFLNGLFTYALIAAERASLLPRLTAVRVVLAAALAAVLVPAAGAAGAALGFVVSELVLVALGSRAATQARFHVGVARPVCAALAAALPMVAAVVPLRANLPLAILVGVCTYGAALALGVRISPRLRRELGYS